MVGGPKLHFSNISSFDYFILYIYIYIYIYLWNWPSQTFSVRTQLDQVCSCELLLPLMSQNSDSSPGHPSPYQVLLVGRCELQNTNHRASEGTIFDIFFGDLLFFKTWESRKVKNSRIKLDNLKPINYCCLCVPISPVLPVLEYVFIDLFQDLRAMKLFLILLESINSIMPNILQC
jgi:hypothetical protein